MPEPHPDPDRPVGEEARKSAARRADSGFVRAYLSGSKILDVGYKGYRDDVVPIVPAAVGVDLDYPGYDGRTLPFAALSQDAVFASHCLEHVKDSAGALRDWFRVLKPGGFLIVMVPHQFLYEKRTRLPSRYNADHKRFYTPASLAAEMERALEPNSYRLRHLADNDSGFDYALPPDRHSGGSYEIELVIEKIDPPAWPLDDGDPGEEPGSRGPAPPGGPPVLDPLVRGPSDGGGVAAVWCSATRMPAAPRILALKLDHLGDFVIGLPSLRRLRQAFPESFIRLVVGPWNHAAALACGLADDVVAYAFFPRRSRGWDGRPVEPVEALRAAAGGGFDIAIDLRVDEDTRFLLTEVQAGLRCGIGARARMPFLDVALPPEHETRDASGLPGASVRFIEPRRFESRMPFQGAFAHETDFRPVEGHAVFGPRIVLPAGRFEAVFDLRMTGWMLGMGRTSVVCDVARDGVREGAEMLASRRLRAKALRALPPDGVGLAFDNDDPSARFEFRVFVAGHPVRTRLRFGGVRVTQLDAAPAARFRRSELHIGERLSMLVQLVADRVQVLYADAPGPTAAEARPRTVVIAPFSNSDLRDWPAGRYAGLARLLLDRLGCEIELIGAADQAEALRALEAEIGGGGRVRNLGASTPWGDLPDRLRRAGLVISNNSGIGHLAAAAGALTLAIYSGSHQPQEWGPRGPRSHAISLVVPCAPCGHDRLAECPHDHRCMRGLDVETVFAEAARLLGPLADAPPAAATISGAPR